MAPHAPFETVLDEHGPAVLRFCIARSGPHAGQDAFQETMLSALRAYPDLRDPGAVRGWLFAIAHRKTIDTARFEDRAPRPAGTPEEVEAVGGAAASRPIPEGPDEQLWQRVRGLPPKQRAAVTLRYLGDLTFAEIGAVMQTSEEAARRSVFEGVRRLRTELADAELR